MCLPYFYEQRFPKFCHQSLFGTKSSSADYIHTTHKKQEQKMVLHGIVGNPREDWYRIRVKK